MMLFRPVKREDVDQIAALAKTTGTGLTTLPKDPIKIKQKVELSIESFASEITSPGPEYYLFVLEDTQTGEIMGTSALAAAVGLEQAFYTYKVSKIVHASPRLGVHKTIETLMLGNDYTGTTEICTLFLSPNHRGGGAGKLLSKGRFLFLAQQKQRFSNKIIAEMRGYSDDNGMSPFWESLGRHFFDMDFALADTRSGEETNEFIAELMPKYPIYVPLLTPQAQAVIGKVHAQTEPALKLLNKEGFKYRGYVDIFDAGPTIEVALPKIDTIKRSQELRVSFIAKTESEQTYLIANDKVKDYRCVLASAKISNNKIQIDESIAHALGIEIGSKVLATEII